MTVSVTIEYDETLIALIDKVAKARGVTRSALIRQFSLEGLGRLSFLPEEQNKALGIPLKPIEKN